MHTNDTKQLSYKIKVPLRKFTLHTVLKIGNRVNRTCAAQPFDNKDNITWYNYSTFHTDSLEMNN
jgi:hypothetical protein